MYHLVNQLSFAISLYAQVADLVETLEEKDDLELFITDEEAVEAVWTAMSALSL